jgi:L-iditol 2-dehydrogenase
MKALVINEPGELQVKDLSAPAIGADEVLVRMRAVGICHSDYELYSGKYIIPIAYPVTPGHEWAGEIVETGKAVGVNRRPIGPPDRHPRGTPSFCVSSD